MLSEVWYNSEMSYLFQVSPDFNKKKEFQFSGGNNNARGSTERFIFDGETWESLSTDDQLKNLHSFTSVELDNTLYVFGGAIGNDRLGS